MRSLDERTIFRCVVGSTVHGLNLPGKDDRDEMAIVLPTAEELYGMGEAVYSKVVRDAPNGMKSQPGDLDLTYHSVKKFLKLAMSGNPTILIPFFVPDEFVSVKTAAAIPMLALRDSMACKNLYYPFHGYMVAQDERLRGFRGQMRVNRPELIAEYGFDTKYAMHIVRLGIQGAEILREGRLMLPMYPVHRQLLMNIRQGKVTVAELNNIIDYTFADLEKAFKDCTLQEKVNVDEVESVLMSIHKLVY